MANALTHRDLGSFTLGQGKSIQIRLLPDKLVITSPGGLRGVTVKQIVSHVNSQTAVNKTLYKIAKRLRTPDGYPIIEGEDGGIREAIQACQAQQLPTPVFHNNGFSFTAIIFRPRAEKETTAKPQPYSSGN